MSRRLRDLVNLLKQDARKSKPEAAKTQQLEYFDVKESNKQVRLLTRRLEETKNVRRSGALLVAIPDVEQLSKEQDGLIGRSGTTNGSASPSQVRALQQEIAQLKVSLIPMRTSLMPALRICQAEHSKIEQRYRHEKLVMLKAWNDLGQRTMRGQEGSLNTSSAGWLRTQRQSVSKESWREEKCLLLT